ncbi:hypothetical protein J4438_01885 [Candidatus Woesearchaeota archaeon]|nr:hypothetical protein [Candidatus Woesearchaeota archaeon]
MNLKQYSNFGFLAKNKKAFIFTLDVAVALTVVFSLLILANYFVVQKTQDPYSTLQILRIGTDLIVVMLHQGYFDNPNSLQISQFIDNTLPERFNMYIISSSGGACNFESGSIPSEDKSITSGKFYFSTGTSFCSARYKIWLD